MIGQRLAHYEITALLGQGGMGQVYRARDEKLNRDVAIKILPDEFAADQQRLQRFQREAQVLASLNHPNIGAIYGLEDEGGRYALVLELVEGQTLEDWICRGAIPVETCIDIAVQVATALEAAHEKGIVHRDLKPANVKITPDGRVKVLDFGLAKAMAGEEPSQSFSESPTLTVQATRAGIILGTAAYMSPEQASGRPVDKRTDVWAFGCVLFELLSGQRAMPGESLAEVMGSVTRSEPDWSKLPEGLPARLRLLLRRCLQKDVRLRLRDMGDARLELSEVGAEPDTPLLPAASSARPWLPWGIALLMALAAGVAWLIPPPAPAKTGDRPVVRLSLNVEKDIPLLLRNESPSLALSADGTRLVYVAAGPSGTLLHFRQLDQYQARPIPGTEGGSSPFFSPDGRSIGYFAQGKLKKVSLSGGAPVSIADAPQGSGGSWGADDSIIFSFQRGTPLMRTTASGGDVTAVTRLDLTQADEDHYLPQLLPGGKAVLFLVVASSLEVKRIAVQSLDQSERRILMDDAAWVHYVDAAGEGEMGHLLFLRSGVLSAVPFDVSRLELAGDPVPVVEGIRSPHLDVSRNGTLIYAPGTGRQEDYSLVWVDRNGAEEPITEAIRGYEDLDLSPDGRRLAFTVEETEAHVWLLDIARNVVSRFVVEGESRDPVWTEDGRFVSYGTRRGSQYGLHRKRFDGGPEETLFLNDVQRWVDPVDWTPGDTALIFTWFHPDSLDDVWMVSPGDPENPRLVVGAPGEQWGAKLSPDGKYLVYVSNESGRWEVYVQPFPAGETRWQASTEGGRNAIWAPDGRELFYRNGDRMMVVPIKTEPSFSLGSPALLFEGPYRESGRDFDVSPDGRRFVMMKSVEPATGDEFRIVMNWLQELESLAPARE